MGVPQRGQRSSVGGIGFIVDGKLNRGWTRIIKETGQLQVLSEGAGILQEFLKPENRSWLRIGHFEPLKHWAPLKELILKRGVMKSVFRAVS